MYEASPTTTQWDDDAVCISLVGWLTSLIASQIRLKDCPSLIFHCYYVNMNTKLSFMRWTTRTRFSWRWDEGGGVLPVQWAVVWSVLTDRSVPACHAIICLFLLKKMVVQSSYRREKKAFSLFSVLFAAQLLRWKIIWWWTQGIVLYFHWSWSIDPWKRFNFLPSSISKVWITS